MSYSEQWQTQITDSLTECAKLAVANNKVDLKYELLIVGIFWPIRQAIRNFDLEAITCVNQIAGEKARPVLRLVQEWGDDPLVVAQALASQGVRRGEISKALNQFVVHFDAFTAYARQLANQVRPAATAALAHDEPPPPTEPPRVLVFALNQDGAALVGELHQRLRAAGIATWSDLSSLEGERTWWSQITQALNQVDFLVLAMTEAALTSHLIRRLWRYARQQGVCIYPIFKADDLHFELLPRWIRQVHFYNVKLEWSKLLDDLKGSCEIPRIPFMADDMPENFVERPALFEQTLAHIFDREQEEGLTNIIALVGPTGYGKTTLATALCHDENIRQVFDNGILWVTLGEYPGDLYRPIIDLIEILSGERPGFTGLDAALVRFGELVTDRDLLIVIDDVWNAAHLKPFLQGGNRCARIITTRNAETLPLEVETIKVGPMLLDEAVALLSSDLPDGYLAERRRLARRMGEWPLLLKLTNGTLRDRVHKHNELLPAALNYAYHALDCQGLTAFDVGHSTGRRRAVGQALEISLRLLDSTERARYNELAIFPDGVNIPLAVLEKLWGATGGLDDFDTEDLCLRLYELCLLAQFDLTSGYIRLHKAMHTYLNFQKTSDLAALHQQLLDAYRVAWIDLPAEDVYMWTHLFCHLVAAGRISELVATVEDVVYLVNKIKIRGVYYAESDLLTAEAASPNNQRLPLVRRALSQASHLLARCDTLDQIANTLQSRLVHLPPAAELLAAAESRLPKPRLTALCAVPDLPDSTLIRTLKGHDSGVLTCAVSGDGSKIVSASKDGCLIVWDAVTGAPCFKLQESEAEIWSCDISNDGGNVVYALNDGRLVLVDLQVERQAVAWQAHHSSVMSCAINADGSIVVSVSKDQSVKIWDTKTRTKMLEFNGHTRTITGCDISADGTTVAAISNDGNLKIWDSYTGREQFSAKMRLRHAGINQLTFVSQRDVNFTCALSADGAVVAAASSGGMVGVWEVASRRERLTFVADPHGVSDCDLNEDGSLLAGALGNNLL
ncbi:MAG: TIR domain-containing protein, partial [Anaerolineae bacterium]|nr:TIR domain-containing protein [Anaerolineae bacterium]